MALRQGAREGAFGDHGVVRPSNQTPPLSHTGPDALALQPSHPASALDSLLVHSWLCSMFDDGCVGAWWLIIDPAHAVGGKG